jgi:hypothetical protein
MIEQDEPPRLEAAGGGEQLARRHGLSAREKWGYGVWLFVGLVFGIPETWAGIANPPWQTLSNTVWHLESLWSPVAIIVVVLIVFIIFGVVRHPPAQAGYVSTGEGVPGRGRTANGRLTRGSAESIKELSVFAYFPVALGIVAAGSLIAATTTSDMWVLGYVIYGLFAIFVVIIPDVLAFWFARDVAFPTLARTVADLERRWRPATMVIVAGLVVLMFHLALPQWPGAIGQPGNASAARIQPGNASAARIQPGTGPAARI